jgi:hypothetical protein
VAFIRVLFSKIGILILAYILVGIAFGPPHGSQGKLPSASSATVASVGDWIQFIIWVMFWPLGLLLHHPTFTL